MSKEIELHTQAWQWLSAWQAKIAAEDYASAADMFQHEVSVSVP